MAELIQTPDMPDDVRIWVERLDTLELQKFARWVTVQAGFSANAWREQRGYERIKAAEESGYHLTEDDWTAAFWADEWDGPETVG